MKSVFRTEVDLCSAFIAAVPKEWTAYAETAGWDIIMVRDDGYQIGVQAKLTLNADVILQTIEGDYQPEEGPDFRAVLVPAPRPALSAVAAYCAVTVIEMRGPAPWRPQFYPSLPEAELESDRWHQMLPTRRHPLPEYVPDVRAGASAPLQLTKWKIGAIKLAILLDQTGYLTRADFKMHGIDIRRWIGGAGWLQASEGGFIAGPRYPDFRVQHPVVWDQITADPKKWARRTDLMVFGATA